MTVTGLVVVDKEPGWTSHDVVARLRRTFGQRRVGHAGTLDPDATGVLLVGVGRMTRLLRFLTDRARLSDLLAIIASLPLLPFLAQLPDRSRALATSSARRPDLVRALPRVYREPAPEPEPADQVA